MKPTILTIDPGTRYMGFAVFHDTELIHYGVKSIVSVKDSKGKIKRGRYYIHQLIREFNPSQIIYEKTYFANNERVDVVNILTKDIVRIAHRKKIPITGIAATTVRKKLCGNGYASKQDVSHVLVSYYPELKPYIVLETKWKADFHFNMFDAIALRSAWDKK
ncbi:MAG: crossover junction endodeoxyribonuclease RuvC [Melioribacteraceae bacterium]|nr:crossover junction endodeoxyribonuclease RuvC [Melioribacteraceae bacterium]